MSPAKRQENKNLVANTVWTPQTPCIANDDEDEIPTLDANFWAKAQMGSPLKKRLISLRLDNDLVDWFKESGPNYQTRMNQVLRSFMEFEKREQIRNR